MDRTSYADPAIVSVIHDRFVPIRVDADRRPDISERYALGGWPTTAFLTGDGEVLGGGTYVPHESMAGILDRVASAFATRGDEIAQRSGTRISGDEPDPHAPVVPRDALLKSVYATYDAEHGGFGAGAKFPITAPLQLALEMHRDTGDRRMAEIATVTLDAMGWGGLYDEIDGGFFRCAATREWQAPHREKLLEVNASLLGLYVDASETLGVTRFQERAADVIRYVQTWLADPVDGGWGGSQHADDVYYDASTHETRRALVAPPVDRVLFAGWNASMVSAALRAARVFEDDGFRDFALTSLERVVLGCYRPGGGVAHFFEGEAHVRGLLDDQIAMATANLDAFEVTGNVVYEMMAQELGHYAVRVLWDEERGGFCDSLAPEDDAVGLMRRRIRPFAANCEAARLFRRLASTSGGEEFADRAEATLAAVAPLASSQGPLAAHYLLALREPEVR